MRLAQAPCAGSTIIESLPIFGQAHNTEVAELISLLRAGQGAQGYHLLPGKGSRGIPVKVWTVKVGAPLVIAFNGAVSQSLRGFPAFANGDVGYTLAGQATVLAIADPSLYRSEDLNVAWYAGDDEFDTPKVLGRLLRTLVEQLQPPRVLFVSGSSGAHPALVHSLAFKDSICIVQNPLAVVSAYYASQTDLYRRHCWPGETRPFSEFLCDDAANLYKPWHRNHVLILQNATDPHITRYLPSLLAALGGPPKSLLLSDHFNESKGHNYPYDLWYNFIRAAVNAPDLDLEAIVRKARATGSGPDPSRQTRDFEIAQRLAALAQETAA